MAVQPGRANPIVFLVLLFFACASASLQVRLPGVDRTVSLSFAFSFIAITELPAGPAFFILGAALLYEAWRVAEKSPGRAEIAFHLAQAAVSTWCTSWVFHSLSHRLAMERLLALGAAAVTYYGISTGASAIQLAVQTSRAPWKVWNEKFFWMGPLFLLVPVAAAIADLLSRASGASERLLGLGLIFTGYRYVKHYFVRLHDSQDHARLLDDIR